MTLKKLFTVSRFFCCRKLHYFVKYIFVFLESHSADTDAFMTGFFCLFADRQSLYDHNKFTPEYVNKLPLSHSKIPVLIRHQQHIKRDSESDHAKHIKDIIDQRNKNYGIIKGLVL